MPGVPLIAAGNPEAATEEGATGPTNLTTVLALPKRRQGRRPMKRAWTGQQVLQTKSSALRQPWEPFPLRLPPPGPPLSPKSMLHPRPTRSPPPVTSLMFNCANDIN
jgi:hypothetical protein